MNRVKEGALEYTRNRKTVQIIIENRKTEIKFRSKPKTRRKIREDVHAVKVVEAHRETGKNTKPHQIANPETRFSVFLPKTGSGIKQKPQ